MNTLVRGGVNTQLGKVGTHSWGRWGHTAGEGVNTQFRTRAPGNHTFPHVQTETPRSKWTSGPTRPPRVQGLVGCGAAPLTTLCRGHCPQNRQSGPLYPSASCSASLSLDPRQSPLLCFQAPGTTTWGGDRSLPCHMVIATQGPSTCFSAHSPGRQALDRHSPGSPGTMPLASCCPPALCTPAPLQLWAPAAIKCYTRKCLFSLRAQKKKDKKVGLSSG